MNTAYTPMTLPRNDNLGPKAFVLDVNSQLFIQKGKMIAYYGNLRFERLGSGLLDVLVNQAFNAPLYINDFVVVSGQGQLILGDNGNDLASYDLEAGNLTVKVSHVLAFEPTLTVKECVVPGYLTMLGTGKFIASSNGPVLFMEPPCRVDEQALLGWADLPCPSFHYDYGHIRNTLSAVGAMLGVTLSGEEKQVDFLGTGTVLVQSSEEPLKGRTMLHQLMSQAGMLDSGEQRELANSLLGRLGGR